MKSIKAAAILSLCALAMSAAPLAQAYPHKTTPATIAQDSPMPPFPPHDSPMPPFPPK